MPRPERSAAPRRLPVLAEAEDWDRLEDLLGAVGRGNQQAFEALFRRMSGPVFGLVRRVLRDAAQAEEVAQEVMVTVWRDAPRYDSTRGTAKAWIMTIAHRRAVDRVRSEATATARLRRVGIRDYDVAFDSVSDAVEGTLEREALRGCLPQLTDLQRESVLLAFYGGHTYPEVAEILGVPLGTVKTRMRDGLIRLRHCLAAV